MMFRHSHRLYALTEPNMCRRSLRMVCKIARSRALLSRTFVSSSSEDLKSEYDAVIVGGGHNGLVTAAYLQKSGLNTCVLERRHILGGAACTEEIIPGFKFSRASYLLSLLRPDIFKDLELKKHGLKVYLRDPNSYTPLLEDADPKTGLPRSLTLGRDGQENKRQIAQFSVRDAEMFEKYEHHLNNIACAIEPLLDTLPLHVPHLLPSSKLRDKLKEIPSVMALTSTLRKMGSDVGAFYELMTAPTTKLLDKWFESEPLKATLATDSVIGAMMSPETPGSGYVLLHHVMGELEGIKGAWGYAEGGMGAVSEAIARSAASHGASIFTEMPVSNILVDKDGRSTGVALDDGTEIRAKMVFSNATPKVTFLDLIDKNALPTEFLNDIHHIDYTSPVTKINVAVDKLPNFLATPNDGSGKPMPHHRGTIHINCENSDLIIQAYKDAQNGIPSKKPVIEMTIPSSLDPTVAPPGSHVVLLFTQYTPYHLDGNRDWTETDKNAYADRVFDCIEKYAPGFKDSVIGRDILTPPDMERIFGLTGGNIFHGSMSLDQLYLGRPLVSHNNTRTPVKGLYLCGSGAHPGGGVLGSPGRLAAFSAMKDHNIKQKK